MGSIKKKPKPFNSMSKSRRIMVLVSLVLVILGCLALYSAMQNEEWTQDEPCQRKVFLIAFLLLITSVALCYYALNGELVEERDHLEADVRLTSVKYGNYNTVKPNSIVTYAEQFKTNSTGMEEKYLKLLQPNEKQSKKSRREREAIITEQVSIRRDVEANRDLRKIVTRVDNEDIPPVFKVADTSKNCSGQCEELKIRCGDSTAHDQQQGQKRSRSLIVELMPLLPLQLCEKELAKRNRSEAVDSLKKPVFPRKNPQITPDVPSQFEQNDKNADAG